MKIRQGRSSPGMLARMMTRIVFGLVLASWLAPAQLPPGLRERLNDPLLSVRAQAVKELGTQTPTPKLSAAGLATLLATAAKDKEQAVREVAVGLLGSGRPPDIAVPALVGALRDYENDCAAAWARMVAKAKEHKAPISEFTNLATVEAYGMAILRSLEDHWDDRAVAGVVQVVKAWKLERVVGPVVRRTCELLCYWGSRPGFDAVVDILSRAQALPGFPRGKDGGAAGAAAMPALSRDDYSRIVAVLDASLGRKGVVKPSGFDSSPQAWKALLMANGPKMPWTLPPSRPSGTDVPRPSGSDAASRPSGSDAASRPSGSESSASKPSPAK